MILIFRVMSGVVRTGLIRADTSRHHRLPTEIVTVKARDGSCLLVLLFLGIHVTHVIAPPIKLQPSVKLPVARFLKKYRKGKEG